jgi:hypothetical protein
MVAWRKQGPVVPTLVITMADKDRKRRSGRASGLVSGSKDGSAPVLWFRTSPDDPSLSLHDWARVISFRKGPMSPEESPATPSSTSTFSPRYREISDYFPHPGSGNPNSRSLQNNKNSTTGYSTGTRERPQTFSSHSPSLRSKRSDISSPSSNYPVHQAAYAVPGQHYTTVLPTDLPSPTVTPRDFPPDLIEGWTSAQGRSSTVSSPTYGRDSISSYAHAVSTTDSSSPPTHRETILDRAFQLKYIPGSENELPGGDKLSSLARFDAIMRGADLKRKEREAAARAEQLAMRSAFEADDSSDSDQDQDAAGDSDSDDDFTHEQDVDLQFQPPLIPPATQRALQYITGRPDGPQSPVSPRPGASRAHMSFHASAAPVPPPAPPARPHTSHGKGRANTAQRRQSAQILPSQFTAELASLSSRVSEEGSATPTGLHRQSSNSMKRLSFSEFTKRLSNTGSLLVVQTNASGGSSRRSSEIDLQSSAIPRTNMRAPGPGAPRDRERYPDDLDKRCSWRGGVGVMASEGGFF